MNINLDLDDVLVDSYKSNSIVTINNIVSCIEIPIDLLVSTEPIYCELSHIFKVKDLDYIKKNIISILLVDHTDPIIIDEQMRLLDGRHRLMKNILLGNKIIKCKITNDYTYKNIIGEILNLDK